MTTLLLSDWRVLVRRWYVVVVGVAVTVALCWVVSGLVAVQYNLASKVLMLPPKTLDQGRPINPYMNLGGLDGMTDVIASAILDVTVSDAMDRAGIKAEYEAERDLSVSGPVLLLDVKGESREDAVKAQDFLLAQIPSILDRLQSSIQVADSTRITSYVITKDAEPEVDRKGQLRALIVIAGLGIGGTYLGVSLLDGYLMSRRKPPAGTARALDPQGQRPPSHEPPPAPLLQPPPAYPPQYQPQPQQPQPQPAQTQRPQPQPVRAQPQQSPPTQPQPQQRPLAGQRSDPWQF